jgi:hypothetical protein
MKSLFRGFGSMHVVFFLALYVIIELLSTRSGRPVTYNKYISYLRENTLWF